MTLLFIVVRVSNPLGARVQAGLVQLSNPDSVFPIPDGTGGVALR
jgi:hypothetical protein